MISPEKLVSDIRREFATVPFPLHCGLHAAIAKDDWIYDEVVLADITQREDFIGDWWDVPIEHLRACMMALTYLDAGGMAFYLPAYMTALIETPDYFGSRSQVSSWQVVHSMFPDREEPVLEQHFFDQFASIHGGKKRVCRDFLTYVSAGSYDEHARELAKEALPDEFWSGEC